MKKYFFLSVFVILISCINSFAIDTNNFRLPSHSSNGKPYPQQDTIQYLQDKIIAHKSKFQHKELNVILNELNLTVKSYSFAFGSSSDQHLKNLTLFFEDSKTMSNKTQSRLTVPFLIIYFENEIAGAKALGLFTKSFGDWGAAEVDFYGKFIVKDIKGLNIIKKR